MSFDVYASSFVPQWLKDIHEAPAQLVYTTPNDFEVQFAEYTSTFAGSSLLGDGVLSLKDQSAVHMPTPPSIGKTTYVLPQPTSYRRLFHKALADEFRSLQISQKRFNLSRVSFNTVDVDRASGSFVTAQLTVPGLRENSPFVRLGDVVQIRPLRLDHMGQPVGFQQAPGHAAFYFRVPGWDGTEFQAVVSGINRPSEIISLTIGNPAELEPYSRGSMNVSFPIRDNWATSQYIAVQDAQNLVSADDAQESWSRKMLFPDPTDGCIQRSLNSAKSKINCFNKLLNFEQLKAVNAVFENNYGILPFLISGPPGTGKTMTTVEAVLQLVLNKKAQHVVVCAPSDPAADALAQRLKEYLKHPMGLFRMNGPSRTFAEVPQSLLAFCYIENNCFGLPPFIKLMEYQVIVTTCRDAEILIRARLTNRDLYDIEHKLQSILHPEDKPDFRPLHWSALFLDEAAQATEPESLIPLTVVAPAQNYRGSHLPQVIMAGDHNQLGPRTASTLGIIKTSLFERLLERHTYSHHPLARSQRRHSGLTKAMLPIYRPSFVDLIRNYRSHPAILAIPNSLFYHDTLLPESQTTHLLQQYPGWKNKTFPVQFICNHGADEQEQENGGWYNVSETFKAFNEASKFLRSGLIDQRDICVMAPFAAQVRHLRNLFRARGMSDVNIGPTEAFQGLESRLVILCTTRSRKRFLAADVERGFGVVNEPKRFNVALTRAKQGLIVIGNPALLACDPSWVAFMEFCRRNGCWEADPLPSDVVGTARGHWGPVRIHEELEQNLPILEKILLNSDTCEEDGKQLGSVMYQDDAMWAAGLHDALPSAEDEDDYGVSEAGSDFVDNEITTETHIDEDSSINPPNYGEEISLPAATLKHKINSRVPVPRLKSTNHVIMPPKPTSFTSSRKESELNLKAGAIHQRLGTTADEELTTTSNNGHAKPSWASVAKVAPTRPKKTVVKS
ncbi:hypothetical protein FKW77_010898 [Venturia effusa]|uniref:Uncharacterized protein n=1 Tax=Venturia effusa TaxID=50376 RepID=A0A517KYT6_9PEZI|nr:hypothetical protein FKW77_010898 [Venturia effusa]